MSVGEEARRSLGGVVRLLRRDPDALEAFDTSPEGFWRSFNAAWILLPLAALFWLVFPTEEVGTGRTLLVQALAYSLSWTLWPLLFFYVARASGWEERFFAYITVYNWAQLLASGGMLAAALVVRSLVGDEAWAALAVPVMIAVLVFEAYIAKHTLDISWGHAAAVEALLVVVTLILDGVREFVLHAGAPPAQ